MENQVHRYRNITLRPHAMQFVINELPLLVLCPIALLYAGLEDMMFATLLGCCAFVMATVLFFRWLEMRRIRYVVTGEQIIYEHGVFHRQVEYLELYRVVDFNEQQTLMQQLFGLKTVSVYSGDRTTPRLDVLGVRSQTDLISELRARVYDNKKKNGIYEITNR